MSLSHGSPHNSRVLRVNSFHELITTPFASGINALCWARTLPGDFAAAVALLDHHSRTSASSVKPVQRSEPSDSEPNDGLVTLSPSALSAQLSARALGAPIRAALETLLEDLRRLREHDRDPVLNLIHGYPRDEDGGPVPTDVFSFHADSAPIAADTWLCTYHGPPSEGLRNEDARRKVDIPEIRAALLKLFGGNDDESFREFLSEAHYDLHYAPHANAKPYSFGVGHLWRIACETPGSPIPPCIHRAPVTQPGDPPRLLLIS